MGESLKIFTTYAHSDTAAKEALKARLAAMARQGEIAIWHDNEMLPGDRWREAISNNLAEADILLYLVSADSLAAENCNRELTEALNADSDMSIIPIILEACDWQRPQLSRVEALPNRDKPIDKWHPESKGWQNVETGIRKVVDKIVAYRAKSAPDQRVRKEQLASLRLQTGNFFIMLIRAEAAEEAYSHAIAHKPNFADAYNNRGNAYNDIGDFDRAIRDFNKAIALKPKFALAYSNRGNAYGFKNDHSRAIRDYNKAIKLNPNIVEAHYNRGVAYAFKGDFNRAVQNYNKAIALKPDFVVAYTNRGVAYSFKQKRDRAIQDFNKAIALNPRDANVYVNRGSTYYEKGEFDRAIRDFDVAIALNPNDAEAHYNRGVVYYSRGVTRLQRGSWKKAKADLVVAKNMGIDIAAMLHRQHGGIAAFERKHDVVLPNDIATMLWCGF